MPHRYERVPPYRFGLFAAADVVDEAEDGDCAGRSVDRSGENPADMLPPSTLSGRERTPVAGCAAREGSAGAAGLCVGEKDTLVSVGERGPVGERGAALVEPRSAVPLEREAGFTSPSDPARFHRGALPLQKDRPK